MATEFRDRIFRAQFGTLLVERVPGAAVALNVEFDVLRTLDRTPNVATLKIFNLNPECRQQVESMKASDQCKLELGYETTGAFEVYRGNVKLVSSIEQEADTVTIVELSDGDEQGGTRFLRSYAKGTKVSAVLRDVLQQSGMGPGNLEAILAREPALSGAKLEQGFTLRSEGMRALSESLQASGYGASVQGGVLQALETEKGLDGQAVLLSPGTGLLGSPSVSIDQKKRIVTAESRIQRGLEPGRQIKVESRFVSGMFVAQRTQYTGSIDGDTFSASIEMLPF